MADQDLVGMLDMLRAVQRQEIQDNRGGEDSRLAQSHAIQLFIMGFDFGAITGALTPGYDYQKPRQRLVQMARELETKQCGPANRDEASFTAPETPTGKRNKRTAAVEPPVAEEPINPNSFRARRMRNKAELEAKLAPTVETAVDMMVTRHKPAKKAARNSSANAEKVLAQSQKDQTDNDTEDDCVIIDPPSKKRKTRGVLLFTPFSSFKTKFDTQQRNGERWRMKKTWKVSFVHTFERFKVQS